MPERDYHGLGDKPAARKSVLPQAFGAMPDDAKNLPEPVSGDEVKVRGNPVSAEGELAEVGRLGRRAVPRASVHAKVRPEDNHLTLTLDLGDMDTYLDQTLDQRSASVDGLLADVRQAIARLITLR